MKLFLLTVGTVVKLLIGNKIFVTFYRLYTNTIEDETHGAENRRLIGLSCMFYVTW